MTKRTIYFFLVLGGACLWACGEKADQDKVSESEKSDFVGEFCGGKAGIQCPEGQKCKLDGDYPDAGGHCIPASYCDSDADCEGLNPVIRCLGNWQCLNHTCQYNCGSERVCGPSILGGECAADQMCDIQTCNKGATGQCVVKADFCTEQYAPVCGCDGQTYGNDCFRVQAGAALDHEGECIVAGSCNPTKALCNMLPPTCPAGQVPLVENSCWGSCVDITTCTCDQNTAEQDCPLDDFTCHGTTKKCGPYL